MKTLNYIISCWGGKRRNPGFYIKEQIDRLNRLHHNLNQVTIMWPFYEGQSNDYKNNYVNSLIELKCGCPIEVIRTQNDKDLKSLYQWFKAFEVTKDKFDYSILIEDDFFLFCSSFDKKCIELIEKKEADVVFSHYHKNNSSFSISTNMICKGNVFLQSLNYIDKKNPWFYFSEKYLNKFKIADFIPQYKVPIWGYKNCIVEYNPFGKMELFVPYQWFESFPIIEINKLLNKFHYDYDFKIGMKDYVRRLKNKLEINCSLKNLNFGYNGHISMIEILT